MNILPNINIYCDESCHLESNLHDVMVLGAVWCPRERAKAINADLRGITHSAGMSERFEIKWGKVSKGRQDMYLELVDYFFNTPDLHFRALVVQDKTKLNHAAFNQTHDEWYYKMYFNLLKGILEYQKQAIAHIYIDYKDTKGGKKVAKLHEILCHIYPIVQSYASNFDFNTPIPPEAVNKIQIVHSHEVPLIQLADLLMGAVGYANRGLSENEAKVALVQRMQQRSGRTLKTTTSTRETKVNIFCWDAATEPKE